MYVKDTDKDGVTNIYRVYEEKKLITSLSPKSLAQGIITRKMEDSVPGFFKNFATAVVKSKKEFGGK